MFHRQREALRRTLLKLFLKFKKCSYKIHVSAIIKPKRVTKENKRNA